MTRHLAQGFFAVALAAGVVVPATAQTTPDSTAIAAPADSTVTPPPPDHSARVRELFTQGNTALTANDNAGALAHFEEALRLDETSLANWLGKGVALEQMGSTDDAVDVYDRIATMAVEQGTPNAAEFAQTARTRRNALLLRTSFTTALDMVQNEQTVTPEIANNALPHFIAASSAGAEELGADGATFQYQYARVLNALGQHQEAVVHAQMGVDATAAEDKSPFYIELGLAQQGAGNIEGARAAFEQARSGAWATWADHYIGLLPQPPAPDQAVPPTQTTPGN